MKMLPAGISQPVLADSIEVMEEFYREKLEILDKSLKDLNVLENSREIAFLCREATRTKKALQEIFRKNKYRNT